ncbi:MAG: phosphotransferase, partial [Deltaproteobacteria bacterium]
MNALPARIGDYRILGRLNAGGEGMVYRVVDRADRRAALKIPASSQPREVAALNGEIRVLRHLNACRVPGVVQLLETGRAGGRPWYTMEWVV